VKVSINIHGKHFTIYSLKYKHSESLISKTTWFKQKNIYDKYWNKHDAESARILICKIK